MFLMLKNDVVLGTAVGPREVEDLIRDFPLGTLLYVDSTHNRYRRIEFSIIEWTLQYQNSSGTVLRPITTNLFTACAAVLYNKMYGSKLVDLFCVGLGRPSLHGTIGYYLEPSKAGIFFGKLPGKKILSYSLLSGYNDVVLPTTQPAALISLYQCFPSWRDPEPESNLEPEPEFNDDLEPKVGDLLFKDDNPCISLTNSTD